MTQRDDGLAVRHSEDNRGYRHAEGLVETTVICAPDWHDEPITLRFWHPSIAARFKSALVDPMNLTISGDSQWRRTTERVARRLKPIGFTSVTKTEMDEALETMRKSGGHACVSREAVLGEYGAMVSIDGTVGSVFDLAALSADYEAYLAASPALASQVLRELERLAPMRFADFNFDTVEVERIAGSEVKRRPGSLARCGLLLGYPVATTAAMILADHGLPGGYSED